jgi:hypothetical protein
MKYPVIRSESDRVWRKYCGFLELSVQEFMAVQETFLLQQIERAALCPLGKKLMDGRAPASVEEYRRLVRLTNYEDYLPELDAGNAVNLPAEPYAWSSTSGAAGKCRRVPYTQEAYQRQGYHEG